jgi:hypothetical protein
MQNSNGDFGFKMLEESFLNLKKDARKQEI